MRFILAAIMTTAVAAPAPAEAQAAKPAAVRAVDCMLITSAAGESTTDQKVKTAMTISASFYAGQAFAYDPAIDLKQVAVAEARRLTSQPVRELVTSCSAEMTKRGAEIIAAGTAVTELGRAPAPK